MQLNGVRCSSELCTEIRTTKELLEKSYSTLPEDNKFQNKQWQDEFENKIKPVLEAGGGRCKIAPRLASMTTLAHDMRAAEHGLCAQARACGSRDFKRQQASARRLLQLGSSSSGSKSKKLGPKLLQHCTQRV